MDEAIFERWGRRWCHLTADSPEELHAFAASLGLEPSRLQTKADRPWGDHYDVTEDERREAVASGAIEITLREAGRRLRRRRRRDS